MLRESSSLRARAWRFVLLTAIMESVRHFGQNTVTQHIPVHPPHTTASFVQGAGGPRQWMGEEVCKTWYIIFDSELNLELLLVIRYLDLDCDMSIPACGSHGFLLSNIDDIY
jgi:hypothetical protein